MLIEFSVGNFRSFRDQVQFSMLAAPLSSPEPEIDQNNTFSENGGLQLLRSAAVYGANASGKSNLIHAISFMREFVLNSSRETQVDEQIPVLPFQLDTESKESPSVFEIVFLLDGRKVRYGFEVSEERVEAEWLFYVPATKEARLFVRESGEISVSRVFKEGRGLEDKTRPNALFLSVVAQFNGQFAESVLRWFKNMTIVSGIRDTFTRTLKLLASSSNRDAVVDLVRKLDLGIADLIVESKPISEVLPPEIPEAFRAFLVENAPEDVQRVDAVHHVFDRHGQRVGTATLDFKKFESAGTNRLFALSGPIIESLRSGHVLVIDELDARLHPLIMRAIVKLFNSPLTNSGNAQLVFTTHNVGILRKEIFRRDQVWFVEKGRTGTTDLYSLAEIRVRNDASFDKDYIRGKYGAIPYLGDLTQLPVGEHG